MNDILRYIKFTTPACLHVDDYDKVDMMYTDEINDSNTDETIPPAEDIENMKLHIMLMGLRASSPPSHRQCVQPQPHGSQSFNGPSNPPSVTHSSTITSLVLEQCGLGCAAMFHSGLVPPSPSPAVVASDVYPHPQRLNRTTYVWYRRQTKVGANQMRAYSMSEMFLLVVDAVVVEAFREICVQLGHTKLTNDRIPPFSPQNRALLTFKLH
eukprot:scaffold1123_cov213-Alexandrium_tamarense.AAC.16